MRRYLLLSLVVIVVLTLAVWAFSQYVQPILPAAINESAILFFIALLAVIAVLGGISDIVPFLHSLINKDAPITMTPEQQRFNREHLFRKVEDIWVEGVLENLLHGASFHKLGLEYKTEMVCQTSEQSSQIVSPGKSILRVFDENCGELLILGEPGSGKTVLLLELTRQAIDRARRESHQPIPIVFDLSSWRSEKTLSDWLVDEFWNTYQITSRVAQYWLNQDKLLLLLDGLDEVKRDLEKCVIAINTFRKDHQVQLVVSSRNVEYSTSPTKLIIHGAIQLQPLTIHKIYKYLAKVWDGHRIVSQILDQDPELRKLLQTPLMLSVIALAYPHSALDGLSTINTVEDKRRHLFDEFIPKMFEREREKKTNRTAYPDEQAVRWLAWLAQKMRERNLQSFALEDLQPDWLHSKIQREQHKWATVVADGLFLGLIGWLFRDLVRGPVTSIAFAVSLGAVGMFFTWRFMSVFNQPTDKIQWSWINFMTGLVAEIRNGWRLWKGKWSVLILVSITGFVLGIIFGVMGGLVAGLIGVLGGLILIPIIAVWYGLYVGFLTAIVSGLTRSTIKDRTNQEQRTEQGVWSSLKNGLKGMVVVGLYIAMIVGLISSLFGGFNQGVRTGLGYGLLFGFGVAFKVYGGLFFLSHFTLRWLLYRAGSIPWNYVSFLKYATRCGLLYQVGGGFRFFHDMLMDHLASMHPGVTTSSPGGS